MLIPCRVVDSRIMNASFWLLAAAAAAMIGVASANESSSSPPLIDELVEWVHMKGGYLNPAAEIRYANPGDPGGSYLGVFAKGAIPAKEVIMTVPHSAYINAGGPPDDDFPNCETVANIAREMELGDASDFGPYAKYLAKQSPGQLPSGWSKAGKQMLLSIGGRNLPPGDPTGWADYYVESCGKDDALHVKAALLSIQRGWDDVNIPLYDLLNHRNGKWLNTMSNDIDWETDAIVQASRDIEAGEQLYGSFNFCASCGNRLTGYGTPEILRDYGFVENYPQRWIFEDLDVGFDIDERDDGTLFVEWTGSAPPSGAADSLEEELSRLKGVNYRLKKLTESGADALPESERRTISLYYEALVVAIERALDALGVEVYDDLNNEENALEHDFVEYPCIIEDQLTYDTYEPLETVQSKYQVRVMVPNTFQPLCVFASLRLRHHHLGLTRPNPNLCCKNTKRIDYIKDPDTRDVCFHLDDVLQICGSYRAHYHEMVVHYTARHFDEVKRVVFVGGGDSMLLHEIVKYKPSLELVVGLEIDQKVTRGAFKHLGVQPLWDDDKVHWWYGDASKRCVHTGVHMGGREHFGGAF